MSQATTAYARASQAAMSPRELEATALLKAAGRLQAICDDWGGRLPDLGEALAFNRKLWTILVTSAARDDNPLPQPVKQSVVDLGMFVFNRTFAVQAQPEAGQLGVLVNINREIAAGLKGSAQPA